MLADYGHPCRLVHVDVDSNPDVARNQCELVINDGIDAVVGAFGA
jgi:ABC-type branched-subunit amino acid transport system substrate-binding protein